MTERQELGSLEAMLFAHAEPVETARLADALRLDADEVTTLLQKLQKRYDEQESGVYYLCSGIIYSNLANKCNCNNN